MVETTCDRCGLAAADLKQCAGCKTAVYCSRDCQAAAWDGHKKECKAIKKQAKAAARREAPAVAPRRDPPPAPPPVDPEAMARVFAAIDEAEKAALPPRGICLYCMDTLPYVRENCTERECCGVEFCSKCGIKHTSHAMGEDPEGMKAKLRDHGLTLPINMSDKANLSKLSTVMDSAVIGKCPNCGARSATSEKDRKERLEKRVATSPSALFSLAKIYWERKDPKATKFVETVAKKYGVDRNQWNLLPRCSAEDKAQAYAYFKESAARGCPEALLLLGNAYLDGGHGLFTGGAMPVHVFPLPGIELDVARGIDFMERSAALGGDPFAWDALAKLHMPGNLGPPDEAKVARAMVMCARCGGGTKGLEGADALGSRLMRHYGMNPSVPVATRYAVFDRADKYFSMAARDGDADAIRRVANLHLVFGRDPGWPGQDTSKVAGFLESLIDPKRKRAVAEDKRPELHYLLGILWGNGDLAPGGRVDYAKAIDHFERAANFPDAKVAAETRRKLEYSKAMLASAKLYKAEESFEYRDLPVDEIALRISTVCLISAARSGVANVSELVLQKLLGLWPEGELETFFEAAEPFFARFKPVF